MSYEVAVVGGGPAGAVAAYMLACAGRRVVLIDAGGAGERKIGESLPAVARLLLRNISLERVLEGHRPSFGNVSAWGKSELVSTDFIQDPHGLGLHLDRVRFDRELREAAQAAGAELIEGRVREASREATGWTMRLDASIVKAACVIDATGRRASIARREGAKRTRDDALVALFTWAANGTADERTLVESVGEGWWYTAPLPNDDRVFAFHTDADIARTLRRRRAGRLHSAMSEAHQVTELVSALASKPGLSFDSRFRITEAGGARLDAFVGRGWVAVGDAALSFDPLAAQGIFNALYTGMKAGEAIDAALRGETAGLSEYTRRLEEIRAAYVERRLHAYGLEDRWPDAPFWHRRMIPRT